jgi:hypothetical protein
MRGEHPTRAVTAATVSTTARAPRAVIVLPAEVRDADRAAATTQTSSLHRALEWMGRVWGGGNMLVVPVVDEAVPEVFTKLARAYDPDIVLPWIVTLSELELRDPPAAEDVARRLLEKAPGRAIGTPEERLRSQQYIVMRASDDAAFGAFIAELNPFPSTIHPTVCAHHLQTTPPRPLMRLAHVVTDGTPASRWRHSFPGPSHSIVDLDLSGLDPWRATMLKMRLGVTGFPQTEPDLPARPEGEIATYIRFNAADQRHLNDAIRIGMHDTDAPDQRALDGTTWSSTVNTHRTPMRQSVRGLEGLSYGPAELGPFLLVVGDTTADATLYQAWRAVYGAASAAWLPSSIAAHPDAENHEYAVQLIRDLVTTRRSSHARGAVTSFSVSDDVLTRLRDHLSTGGWDRDAATTIGSWAVQRPDRLDVPCRPQLFTVAPETFEMTASITMVDGVSASPIQAPIPSFVGNRSPLLAENRPNWVAYAVVDACKLTAHPGATSAAIVTEDRSTAARSFEKVIQDDVRCSSDGTTWIAKTIDDVPDGINEQLSMTAVTLRTPTMPGLLDALAADHRPPHDVDSNNDEQEGNRDGGSTSASHRKDGGEDPWGRSSGPAPTTALVRSPTWMLSGAGTFYDQFTLMCGGLSPLLNILRDHHRAGILRAFDDPDLKGITVGERKYLRLLDFRRAFGGHPRGYSDIPTTRAITDEFISAGIFTRGLVLKCSRCRNTDFYPLEDLGRSHQCRRCSQRDILLADSWCNTPTHEPAWCYRRDEVAHQALRHNIEGPAFALARLGADAPGARYTWAFEMPSLGRPTAEVDFACLVDGRLSVGEAKTNDKLGKTSKEARSKAASTARVAAALAADQVVFATTQPRWSASSENAIDNLRKDRTIRWCEVSALVDLV